MSKDIPLKVKFDELSEKWKNDTRLSSSVTDIVENKYYRDIINIGQAVLPMILNDLKSSPGHWFHALKEITGEDPIDPKDYGDMTTMQRAWVEWGERKGVEIK
jgi:hypothetical protein